MEHKALFAGTCGTGVADDSMGGGTGVQCSGCTGCGQAGVGALTRNLASDQGVCISNASLQGM